MSEQALETLWEIQANPRLVWNFLSRVESWQSWWPQIKEAFKIQTQNPGSYYLFWQTPSSCLGLDLQVTDEVCGELLEAHLEGGFLRFVLRCEGSKTQVWASWVGLSELNLTAQMLEDLGQNLEARLEAGRGWLP